MDIAFGPYIGDFNFEVFYFLPYINWIKDSLKPEKIFVSSHYNREFLYSNFTDKFFEINPLFSADELNQENHYNKLIFKNHCVNIQKKFIQDVQQYSQNVVHYNFNFNRYKKPCSFFQLKYKKLDYRERYSFENKILFIPEISEEKEFIYEIYKYLKNILGDSLVVIGDMKTHLKEHNILWNKDHYTDIVYKDCIDIISSCKGVICPASTWTGISNLQGKNILSWGQNISEYKENGHYSFNNNGLYYPALNIDVLKKCLDNFLEEKC